MNRDGDKLGETIRNTVQEAIDSQDFEMLNQGYSYKEQTVDQQQQVSVQRYRRTTAVKV